MSNRRVEHTAQAQESTHTGRGGGCRCNKWYWLDVTPFCPLRSHFDSRVLINLISACLPMAEWCVQQPWDGGGVGERLWGEHSSDSSFCDLLPFSSSASHLLSRWTGSRSVYLELLSVVNPKKNLKNFFNQPVFLRFCFLFICPFPLADSLDSETQGHRFKNGKEIMALSTGRKNLALRHFLWTTAKLQRPGPDKAFHRGLLHHHWVSVSIASSCFSRCSLCPGLKWPLHGKHVPSGVRTNWTWRGGVRVCGLLSEIPLSTQTRPCNCCSESWGFLRRWSPDSPRWQGPPKICPQPGPWPFPCSLFQFSGQDSMVEWENGPGGRRSGVVSGELGSSRAPSLTGCVVSFLSQ